MKIDTFQSTVVKCSIGRHSGNQHHQCMRLWFLVKNVRVIKKCFGSLGRRKWFQIFVTWWLRSSSSGDKTMSWRRWIIFAKYPNKKPYVSISKIFSIFPTLVALLAPVSIRHHSLDNLDMLDTLIFRIVKLNKNTPELDFVISGSHFVPLKIFIVKSLRHQTASSAWMLFWFFWLI